MITDRETEIIELLAEGLNYREIGKKLYISHLTVRDHMKNIRIKYYARTTTQAVATWVRNEQN